MAKKNRSSSTKFFIPIAFLLFNLGITFVVGSELRGKDAMKHKSMTKYSSSSEKTSLLEPDAEMSKWKRGLMMRRLRTNTKKVTNNGQTIQRIVEDENQEKDEKSLKSNNRFLLHDDTNLSFAYEPPNAIKSWSEIGPITRTRTIWTKLALSGDGKIMAVAMEPSPFALKKFGSVRVLKRGEDDNNWKQIGQTIVGEITFSRSQFGFRVNLSENGRTLAVSDPSYGFVGPYGPRPGRIFVFSYNANTNRWMPMGAPIDAIEHYENGMGYTMSLSADGLTLATKLTSKSFHMAAHVFKYNGGSQTWDQVGGDIHGDASLRSLSVVLSGDGRSIAVSGLLLDPAPPLLPGCNRGVSASQVQVFTQSEDGSSWSRVGGVMKGVPVCSSGERPDVSLSRDGRILAVGVPPGVFKKGEPGYVAVYRLEGDTWKQLGERVVKDPLVKNYKKPFGTIVEISDDGYTFASSDKCDISVYSFDGEHWFQQGEDLFPGYRSIALSRDGRTVAGAGTGAFRLGDKDACAVLDGAPKGGRYFRAFEAVL